MVVAWSFCEKDRMCNEPKYKAVIHIHIFRKQEYQFVAHWSKKYKLHFLAVQEDDSEWSIRTWTAQVSFQRFQFSYLTIVPPTVFTYSRTVRVAVCLLIMFFFLFYGLFSGPAHILCLIVASGWNKERCIPEILPSLLSKIGSWSLLFQGVIIQLPAFWTHVFRCILTL
jgi:hypothetical protein